MEVLAERPVTEEVKYITPKTLFYYRGDLYMKLVSNDDCVEAVNLDSGVYEHIDNSEKGVVYDGVLTATPRLEQKEGGKTK